jgi:hypothetical protein
MKKLPYILAVLFYYLTIYIGSNWSIWNISFIQNIVGFLFVLILTIIFVSSFTDLFKKSLLYSILTMFAIAVLSSFFFLISIYIGEYQTKSKLKIAKSKVDQYKNVNGYYPDEEFIQNLDKPMFLWFNGKYFLDLDENHKFINLNIEANGGDYGLSIYKNNKIERYDY